MNNTPPLRKFKSVDECRKYFEEKYCKEDLITFDNIAVRFYPEKFDDAFFESKNKKERDKSIFSIKRAERIDWIEYVLKSEEAELYVGWNRDKKTYRKDRRIAIISPENYVVIITLLKDNNAKFITAYLADSPNTAKLIRKNPRWTKK